MNIVGSQILKKKNKKHSTTEHKNQNFDRLK